MTAPSPNAPTNTLSPDEAMLCRAMIDTQLRPNGVTNGALIGAIAAVRRGDFVAAGQLSAAYADRAVPLSGARALSPVLTTARLLQAAGARSIDAAVTHALFTPQALDMLRASGVGEVWSTDCINHPSNAVAMAPLLAQALRDISAGSAPGRPGLSG